MLNTSNSDEKQFLKSVMQIL